MEQGEQRNSRNRGPVVKWAQRTRGTVDNEDQRVQRTRGYRGPEGTEDQRTSGYRGTVGTEDHRTSGYRGPVVTTDNLKTIPSWLFYWRAGKSYGSSHG